MGNIVKSNLFNMKIHVQIHQYTPQCVFETRAHKGYTPYTLYFYKIYNLYLSI
jgi:hypothetical protein